MLVIIAKTDDQDSLIVSNSVVASKGRLGVFLADDWDASATVASCVAKFLGCESIESVKERVATGSYKVVSGLTIL